MSLVALANGAQYMGQSLISEPPASVIGLKYESFGITTCAPAADAALLMPLIVKQLAGSFIELSVTMTLLAFFS